MERGCFPRKSSINMNTNAKMWKKVYLLLSLKKHTHTQHAVVSITLHFIQLSLICNVRGKEYGPFFNSLYIYHKSQHFSFILLTLLILCVFFSYDPHICRFTTIMISLFFYMVYWVKVSGKEKKNYWLGPLFHCTAPLTSDLSCFNHLIIVNMHPNPAVIR